MTCYFTSVVIFHSARKHNDAKIKIHVQITHQKHAINIPMHATGVVGRGPGGTASPPLFWTEIRAKVSPLLVATGYLLKRSVR